jgi:hypothetical protein
VTCDGCVFVKSQSLRCHCSSDCYFFCCCCFYIEYMRDLAAVTSIGLILSTPAVRLSPKPLYHHPFNTVTLCRAATGTSDVGGCWTILAYPCKPSPSGLLLYVVCACYCFFVFVAWGWLADPQIDVSEFLTTADCLHTRMFDIRRFVSLLFPPLCPPPPCHPAPLACSVQLFLRFLCA